MYNNQLIGQNVPQQFNPTLNPLQQARASGVVQEYKFITFKYFPCIVHRKNFFF